MEQKIRDRYHDGILQEARQRYAIAPDQIRPLDAFESFIYEFARPDGDYILRLGHTLRKSEALIHGEVDWINYLAAGGVGVAKAIHSANGQLVEAIDDGQGGHFLATAFVKAKGQSPWDIWTPTLYENYGRLLGQMHALARYYEPANPTWRRPAWDDEGMNFVERYLPAAEVIARQKFQALRAYLQTLPQESSVYGLTHQDAHGSNFLVDDHGNITLFDFDDCGYGWYANDIAIVLFYTVQDADDWPAFTQEFMTHFLRGYQQVYRLEPAWLAQLPHFLKLRELELYGVMHRDFDVNHIDNEWCARFMAGRKARIEQDAPFIEFDFMSLATHLG